MHTDSPEAAWPGDPSTIWTLARLSRTPGFARPGSAPAPESADEVARWEDPDGFGRIELFLAPIFWVCLPLVALGIMIHGAITNPTGIGFSGTVFGEHVQGGPWSFWIAWVAIIAWLLVAIGVLVLRAGVIAPDVRKDAEWIYAHGVAHSIHPAPLETDDGDGGRWPTFIAIDHRLPEERSARVFRALHAWLAQPDVQGELEYGSLQGRKGITSAELFGPLVIGGTYLGSIPGVGPSGNTDEREWVLITTRRESEDAGPHEQHVTIVPPRGELRRIRARLRRSAR